MKIVRWKVIARLIIGVAFLFSFQANQVSAENIPRMISYDGTLTDSTGTVSPNGGYDMEFNIYNVQTGGVSIWTETWDANTNQVVVIDGKFNVMLGAHNPIPSDLFSLNSTTYLGITVGDDQEMLPRQMLTSVAYAFTAGNVQDPVDSIPSNVIVMWHGTINDIPDGWALCDGTNGTPDLRDRFVLGGGGSYQAEGGAKSHSHNVPSHLHGISNSNLNHRHNVNGHTHPFSGTTNTENKQDDIENGGHHAADNDHKHTFSGTTGTSSAHKTNLASEEGYDLNHSHGGNTQSGGGGSTESVDHLPPYFALAFIMKL